MALTYPQQVEAWESCIEGSRTAQALTLMDIPTSRAEVLAIVQQWGDLGELADTLFDEVKAWREQAAGHEASRALLQERFDEQVAELRKVSTRLSWVEENAKRMQRYLKEQATCPECGCSDFCCQDCDYLDTEYPEIVPKAREALGGFAP